MAVHGGCGVHRRGGVPHHPRPEARHAHDRGNFGLPPRDRKCPRGASFGGGGRGRPASPLRPGGGPRGDRVLLLPPEKQRGEGAEGETEGKDRKGKPHSPNTSAVKE